MFGHTTFSRRLDIIVLHGLWREDRTTLRTYIKIQTQEDIDRLIQHLETIQDRDVCVLNLEIKAQGVEDFYLAPPFLIRTLQHREDLKVFLQRILFKHQGGQPCLKN